MKTLKRYGLMLIVAAVIAPLAVQSIGCKAESDPGEGEILDVDAG